MELLNRERLPSESLSNCAARLIRERLGINPDEEPIKNSVETLIEERLKPLEERLKKLENPRRRTTKKD